MKLDKKLYILLILLPLVILIIWLCCLNKNKNIDGIVEVRYSTNDSYGTESSTSSMVAVISKDGIVTFANSYNAESTSLNISPEKFSELVKVINDNSSIFYNKVKEDENISDGSYSYITIKTVDGEMTVGGYMVSDQKYINIENKILEVVGKETFFKYKNEWLTY